MSRTVASVWLAGLGLVAACAGILGLRDQPQKPFAHRVHGAKGIACVQCHARVAQSEAAAALDLPAPASCLQCHAQPHDSRPCGGCHGADEHRERAAQAKQHLTFSHRDHHGVTQGRCTRCHEGVLSDGGPLLPTMASCLSCHEHRREWTSRTCSPCHVRLESEGTRPESHVVHGGDFLQRHGMAAAASRDLCTSCHAQSECAECHAMNAPALPSTLRFDEPRRAELHGKGFLARHSLEARIDPGLCTSCHGDERVCRDCHTRERLLQVTGTHASPHPADWVGTRGSENRHGHEARRNPMACASCHGGGGETLCVGCHRVGGGGGSPHPSNFDSNKSLDDMPCRMCHGGRR